MLRNIKRLKERYNEAKNANVGDEIICPSCGTSFIKTNYQTKFCKTRGKTKCKDHYWNNVTETKRNNTIRISPASAKWTAQQEISREDSFNPDDYEHPFSSEALGQW
jgi:hypothetical protein